MGNAMLTLGDNITIVVCIVLVFAASRVLGKMSDDIPIKYTGEKLDIAFNARYMIDALKNSECDEVRIDFTGALFPIRIRPLEDDSFVGIVLPVRSK